MMPVIFTGWPDRSVGVNFANFAACSAACCNSDGPLTAFAEITLPFVSMTTLTSTIPIVRARLAISGYMGAGRLRALPLSMPPEMGLSGPLLTGRAGASPSSAFTEGPPPSAFVPEATNAAGRLGAGTTLLSREATATGIVAALLAGLLCPCDAGTTPAGEGLGCADALTCGFELAACAGCCCWTVAGCDAACETDCVAGCWCAGCRGGAGCVAGCG